MCTIACDMYDFAHSDFKGFLSRNNNIGRSADLNSLLLQGNNNVKVAMKWK